MKGFTICLLTLLSCLPAWSQQSSYDPAAKQPAKRGGLVDFALNQVNPQNRDYGCRIDEARKLFVDQTIKNLDSWAVLVALSFLILSFCLLLQQHQEQNRREIIASFLLAQYHNALADARSQAEEATSRHNELVGKTNTAAEAALRQASQPPERLGATLPATNPTREVRPRSASMPPAKDKFKSGENGAGQADTVPTNHQPEGDFIAQVSTLQQQLTASHEREKNLQKELTKAQRRGTTA